MKIPEDRLIVMDRATEKARAMIKVGDRIARTLDGGAKATFTFTHWESVWLCGKTVYDCHAINVYAVNRQPVTFG